MELNELLLLPAVPSKVYLNPEEIPFQALYQRAQIDPMVLHTTVCCNTEECSGAPSLMFCKHNPFRSRTPEEWEPIVAAERKARELARQLREAEVLEEEAAANSFTEDFSQTDTQTPTETRNTRRRTNPHPFEGQEHKDVLNDFDGKNVGTQRLGVVALAQKYNRQTAYVSQFLKDNGREVKKGANAEVLAKARAVVEARRDEAHPQRKQQQKKYTDEQLTAMYHSLGSVQAVCEQTGIYHKYVSDAVKRKGVQLRKGHATRQSVKRQAVA